MAGTQDHPIHIIGAGITGLTTALALSRFVSPAPRITISEARRSLPTLGGAVNVTPNGLRYLAALGALPEIRARGGADVRSIDLFTLETGASIGKIQFETETGGPVGEPGFHALRVRRADLLAGMLDAAMNLPNVDVQFGKKLSSISQTAESASVSFDNGITTSALLVLGCDGIHSAVRRHLDPEREPQYTGVAVVNGYTALRAGLWRPARDTSFLATQQGRFFASYYEPRRENVFVCGVWETPDVASRDGWTAKGKDQEALQGELRERFGGGAFEGVGELIDSVDEWSLYPVYNLPPRGVWAKGWVVLLGDAAHAMSPQGESATIAMEDAVIFARLLGMQGARPIEHVIAAYEKNRRERVEAAYADADANWRTIKDPGWLAYKIQELVTPAFLWWTAGKRRRIYEEDLATAALEL